MNATQGPRVLTSDIFDTAVMRVVGRPSSAFLLLGQRLRAAGAWTWDARVFAIQRVQAEATAQTRADGGEPSLADIYDELAPSPFLTDPRQAMDAELQLERELIVRSPYHARRLDAARAAGTRVSFVSDTYFPSEFLREVLGPLARDGETIYASCEHGLSKRAGTMFARVLELEGEPSDHLLHVGDDRSADGTMARRSGINAELCDEPTLNRYEAVLERHAVDTAGVTSLLAGCARVVRATRPPGGLWTAQHEVAASVAGPLLGAFVAWTLEAARTAGCSGVAYTSRGGPLLHAIAARLDARGPGEEPLLLTCVEDGTAPGEGRSIGEETPRDAGPSLIDHLTEPRLGRGRWALVELGWRGHTAASVNRVLEDAELTPPLHLSMGLVDPDPGLTGPGDWHTYLYGSTGPGEKAGRCSDALPRLVAALCAPAAGAGSGPPEARPDAPLRWGDGELPATVLAVVDRLAPFAHLLVGVDARPALLEVLTLFLGEPDPAETEGWPFGPEAGA